MKTIPELVEWGIRRGLIQDPARAVRWGIRQGLVKPGTPLNEAAVKRLALKERQEKQRARQRTAMARLRGGKGAE